MGFGAEIVTAGNGGEIEQVAGIKETALGRPGEGQVDLLFDAVAVAGRADHGAAAAAQALIAPLFPDRGLEFQVHQLRHDGDIHLGLEL